MATAVEGKGAVPDIPLLSAVVKRLFELPTAKTFASNGLPVQWPAGFDFTADGLSAQELRTFFSSLLGASRGTDPIIESGNKYGKTDLSHRMNGELLMHECKASERIKALSAADRARMVEILEVVLLNDELRNRNPLHASLIDATIIGNLMNFPMHIFGFPYASYATDGNESLSLCLYAHRQRALGAPYGIEQEAPARGALRPRVVYVAADGEEPPTEVLLRVTRRLNMVLQTVTLNELASTSSSCVAAVMAAFSGGALTQAAEWAAAARVPAHVHVLDAEWRDLFLKHPDGPIHFELHPAVASISIEQGLLSCGYACYRELRTRDAHFDVGRAWQTAYMSPNEGGSGASTPLFVDFCLVMLGWRALARIAGSAPGDLSYAGEAGTLQPTQVRKQELDGPPPLEMGPEHFDTILRWAKATMADGKAGRAVLEAQLLGFQRHFLGGMGRDLELISSGGGTRSINLAFEAVLAAQPSDSSEVPVKVLTGNPHLAVERAARRFGFELGRLASDGALCPVRLAAAIGDPNVVAVYAQTLSYTDGIADDLPAILAVIEKENLRRASERDPSGTPKRTRLVHLINDSCLAFCALVHNDGVQKGRGGKKPTPCLRLLDLSVGHTTPVLVTLDAHKHLGSDKGVSTVVGTRGTLERLRGKIKVGSQPSKAMLVRALADMCLVGVQGYMQLYHSLAIRLEKLEAVVANAGLTIVHASNRPKGSTVISCEDRDAVITKRLKKRGHAFAPLFNLHPDGLPVTRPDKPDKPGAPISLGRSQLGWSLSLTPYSLREISPGRTALDVFTDDLLDVCAELQADNSRPKLARLLCAQDSLASVLLCGGDIDPPVMNLLWTPGPGRWLATTLVRRLYGQILDGGVVASHRRANPLQALLGLLLFLALAALSPYMVALSLGVRANFTDADGTPPSPWPVRVAALAVGASFALLRAAYIGPASGPAPRAATSSAAKPSRTLPAAQRPTRSPARRAA